MSENRWTLRVTPQAVELQDRRNVVLVGSFDERNQWQEVMDRLNAHDELVAALEALMPLVEIVMGPHERDQPGVHCLHCDARALLARIKGESNE